MRKLTKVAVAAAALTLTLTACGGDDYDEDTVDALKALGASQEEAECFIDELGEDDAKKFLEASDGEVAPEDSEKYLAALDECGVQPD